MKAKRTLLVLGLLGVMQATAFSQSTNSVLSAHTAVTTKTSAPVQSKQPKIEPIYPASEFKLVEPKLKAKEDRIIRIGGESSQAWTTIASEQPNLTVVHDAMVHEPRFCLLSLSFGRKP